MATKSEQLWRPKKEERAAEAKRRREAKEEHERTPAILVS
jgi:hypothetical protein